MRLTVVTCTHNRSGLLRRVLASLNAAARPSDCVVELLVVANACTDDTGNVLHAYESQAASRLPLRWTEEPVRGKSSALNRAIGMIADGLIAFVDDDHRVDPDYLVSLVAAARRYPDTSLFCGRIVPDWDGHEPDWVHDAGPYRIYPLPIPHYDQGHEPKPITAAGPAPGGGNLWIRREVFQRVGVFEPELGPHGHDLSGGEDSEFVHRCLASGERIQYVPEVLQYHYVDLERLRLRYLLTKAFQRSRSGIRIEAAASGSVPLYMWRKLATYLIYAGLSLDWARTRFYLVRVAAALGEIRGFRDPPAISPAAAPKLPNAGP